VTSGIFTKVAVQINLGGITWRAGSGFDLFQRNGGTVYVKTFSNSRDKEEVRHSLVHGNI
jgi:hypothetical protein